MSSSLAQNITKIIVMSMIGLGVLALTLMDVRGVMSDAPGIQDAATVNGERITTRDLAVRVETLARQMSVPRERIDEAGLKQYVLQGLVIDKLTDEALQDMGLRFSDKAVAAELRTMLADPQNPGGDLAQRYEMILRQTGQNRKDFENSVRTQIARRIVGEALSATLLPDPLMDNVMKARAREKRDVVLITIPANLPTPDITPDADALQALYEARQAEFTIPESRSGRVFALPQDSLDKIAGADGDAQQTLVDIEDAFFGGEKPEDVAKQYGLSVHKTLKDVKNAAKDDFAAALFDLEAGEVSSALPLEDGQPGYAFVVLDGVVPATVRPLSEVRKPLIALWKDEQERQKAAALAQDLKGSEDPIAFAQKEGLKVETRKAVSPSEDLAPLFDTASLNAAIPLPTNDKDLRLGVVTGIAHAESQYAPREASLKEFQAAQAKPADELFMLLMAPYAEKARITVNDKALASASAPQE